MKNTRLKFFIDTTVAISALTGRNTDAWILLESGKREVVSLFVNAVNYIKECCVVRKNVPKTEFMKYSIRDKNDIPVLAGASHESAVLVTEDSVLKEDAEKYIECATPSEALKKLSNASEKLSA